MTKRGQPKKLTIDWEALVDKLSQSLTNFTPVERRSILRARERLNLGEELTEDEQELVLELQGQL